MPELDIDFKADSSSVDKALDKIEARVAKIQSQFWDTFFKVDARMPGASLDAKKARTSQIVKEHAALRGGSEDYKLWESDQRRVEREVKADQKGAAQAKVKADRDAKRQADKDARRLEKEIADELKNDDRMEARRARLRERLAVSAFKADARREDTYGRWQSEAINKEVMAESNKKSPSLFEQAASTLYGEKGTKMRGFASGAARVVGGAAIGAMGGGGLLGTALSSFLGPLGLLGGAISSVVGAVMRSGSALVSHTTSMLGEMKQVQLGTGGSKGMWQASAIEAARWGMSKEEFASESAATFRAASGRVMGRFDPTTGPGVLGRGAQWGFSGGDWGRYAGLANRYGVSTGGMRGGERLASMFHAAGLQGPEAFNMITSGYESLAQQGLGVDTAGFESFLGRAMSNDTFRSGGLQSIRGVQALEGIRGGGFSSDIKGMMGGLATTMMDMRAMSIASKSGKAGFGWLSEYMRVKEEDPSMGAEGARDMMAGFGVDAGGLMAGAFGLSQKHGRALMEGMPTVEPSTPGGQLPSPYDTWGQQLLGLTAGAGTNDIRRMGSADDIKELIKLQQTQRDAVFMLAGAAEKFAGAVNWMTGKR